MTDSVIDTNSKGSLKSAKSPVTTYLKDTLLFTHIKYDFYKDSEETLFWRYTDNSDPDSIFINYVDYFQRPTSDKKIFFKNFIDIDSYKELDSCLYSIDKNHVFYFIPCSCGGSFWIVEGADPKTFRHVDSYKEGQDKRYIYYGGERVAKHKSSS